MAARLLVCRAVKASLATLDRLSGHPYASLVTVATEPDGRPLFFLSKLALHTQNLAADPRASVLFDGTNATADPLAGGRVTVIGRLEPTASLTAKARFLARHRQAEMYAGFADFSLYALSLERAHFIGGFGRIVDLAPRDLLIDLSGAEALVAAEAEIVAHMNADHAGALELFATELCGAPPCRRHVSDMTRRHVSDMTGDWRMTGIDPEGCDLLCDGDARRVLFASRVTSPGEARLELVRLAVEARARGNKT